MSSLCRNPCENCRTPEWVDRILAIKCVHNTIGWTQKNCLLVTTVTAVVLGLFIGAAVRGSEPTPRTLMLIAYPGELFLRALKMMTIPIIVASVVSGTAALDVRTNGKMSGLVIGYFILTSLMSACLGMFLVVAIRPGHPWISLSINALPNATHHPVNLLDSFIDLFRNSLPDNLLVACINQTYTDYQYIKPDLVPIGENATEQLERVFVFREQSNVLGLIVFFTVFGAILSTMGERGRMIAQYFYSLNKIIMTMVRGIIWFMPIGVASLICERMASLAGKVVLLEDLVLYCLVVVFGLAIHQFVLLPLFYYAVVRKNPFTFYWNNMEAILTAFATESSSAALPITIRNMVEKNHADKLMANFVLPIGATINMNGTALFVAVATMFIAQINNHVASVSDIITVIITSTAVSVASSATPGAAIFLMAMSLSVLPLKSAPIGDVRLLLIIDWLLGRCRTTNNVAGDCFAVAIFQHVYREDLAKLKEREEKIIRESHPYLKH